MIWLNGDWGLGTRGYISNEGSSNCTICPAGTFETNDHKLCKNCSSGYYSEEGVHECSWCPKGFILNGGSSKCTICPAGTFEANDNTKCKECNNNYDSLNGSDLCFKKNSSPSHVILVITILRINIKYAQQVIIVKEVFLHIKLVLMEQFQRKVLVFVLNASQEQKVLVIEINV